jgi:D-alanine-D-alanine ligase
MLGVLALILLMTNWWMRCYTNHGESVQVDDFTGLRMKDAVKKGKNKGFQFEVIDSSWQLGKPGGIILNQTPKPLSRVKEGRKIYLTVTTYGTETVRLPEFSNYAYDFSEYQKRLKILQIEAKEVEKVFDRKQAPGTILYFTYNGKKITEAEVKKGVEIPKGSTLEFTVTDRKSNRVELPDLVCRTFDAADFLVGSYNLNIGQVIEDETVTERFSAYVYRQEPEFDPDETVQMGTQINVWLTQDLPADCNRQ